MLQYATWHGRISKAWRKKVAKRKKKCLGMRGDMAKECTVRIQDGLRVHLAIWDDVHAWSVFGPDAYVHVQVDKPLSQAELFRWLEKTTPIE